MRTITATEASRNFKLLLNAVERGESVAIMRGGNIIAEVHPRPQPNAKAFFEAVEQLPKLTQDEYEAALTDLDRLNDLLVDDSGRPWFTE
jgi:antitoxin (DNA-binding transcriptional repressor) of toxin-antitoxin stability system